MQTKQRAAQKRTSWIRSLRGIRVSLIEDPRDREALVEIIDRQLASMGAETLTERCERYKAFWNRTDIPSDEEYEALNKTGKPYKITDEDVRRYTSW